MKLFNQNIELREYLLLKNLLFLQILTIFFRNLIEIYLYHVSV